MDLALVAGIVAATLAGLVYVYRPGWLALSYPADTVRDTDGEDRTMDEKIECPPRYTPAGRLVAGKNVSRCGGCCGLILEEDEVSHVCIADVVADLVRRPERTTLPAEARAVEEHFRNHEPGLYSYDYYDGVLVERPGSSGDQEVKVRA